MTCTLSGLQKGELCEREGIRERLLGRPDSAPHGVHKAPRAPAVRALSEGREEQVQGSSSGSFAAKAQRRMDRTRIPGP